MNKLMARIVAVVMAVMMLGTVSFAANLNEANNEIPANSTETAKFADVWTVKAVAENGVVVAMYQGTEPGAIAINPEKLGDSKYVDVEYSGKTATGAEKKSTVRVGVNPEKPEDVKASVELAGTTYEFGGKTYTSVAHIAHKFIPQAVATRIGYILSATGGTTTGAENVVAYEGDISGGLEVNFDVVVLNVPDGVTISAEYFIEY